MEKGRHSAKRVGGRGDATESKTSPLRRPGLWEEHCDSSQASALQICDLDRSGEHDPVQGAERSWRARRKGFRSSKPNPTSNGAVEMLSSKGQQPIVEALRSRSHLAGRQPRTLSPNGAMTASFTQDVTENLRLKLIEANDVLVSRQREITALETQLEEVLARENNLELENSKLRRQLESKHELSPSSVNEPSGDLSLESSVEIRSPAKRVAEIVGEAPMSSHKDDLHDALGQAVELLQRHFRRSHAAMESTRLVLSRNRTFQAEADLQRAQQDVEEVESTLQRLLLAIRDVTSQQQEQKRRRAAIELRLASSELTEHRLRIRVDALSMSNKELEVGLSAAWKKLDSLEGAHEKAILTLQAIDQFDGTVECLKDQVNALSLMSTPHLTELGTLWSASASLESQQSIQSKLHVVTAKMQQLQALVKSEHQLSTELMLSQRAYRIQTDQLAALLLEQEAIRGHSKHTLQLLKSYCNTLPAVSSLLDLARHEDSEPPELCDFLQDRDQFYELFQTLQTELKQHSCAQDRDPDPSTRDSLAAQFHNSVAMQYQTRANASHSLRSTTDHKSPSRLRVKYRSSKVLQQVVFDRQATPHGLSDSDFESDVVYQKPSVESRTSVYWKANNFELSPSSPTRLKFPS